ncbi:MAG: rhodanese-like domain-containing protein [Elainellaceae cyanobacterium]
MGNVDDTILAAKNAVTAPLPSPPSMDQDVSAKALKKRLDWGEPALSILDVRPKAQFDSERLLGAINVPGDNLVADVRDGQGLEATRDLFLYGGTDGEAAQAASQLRQAGYKKVAVVNGGLSAWKSCGGAVEGTGTH